MSREELLKTIRLCKTDGNAECEECSLHGAKGDCVATLLQECEEEIVFLDGLLAAERMLEDALRKQVALRNERLDKMCAEIDHLREATKMMPKWVSVSERTEHRKRLNARIAYAAAIERWAEERPILKFWAIKKWLKAMPRKEDFYG